MNMDTNSIILLSQKKILQDLIFEIENIELPPDWRSKDAIRFILNKIKEKENKL